MLTFWTNRIFKASVVAVGMTAIATAGMVATADAAYAQKGGNGNGNGGGNDSGRDNGNGRGNDRDRGQDNARNNGNGGGNGRGNVARELRGLNAAHANQRALENASPNSMPGKLYAYQQARREFIATIEEQNEAYDEYNRLVDLTDEEIAAEFPEGGYEEAVTTAADTYRDARADAVAAQEVNDATLAAAADGRELSNNALAELHSLLGL